ncbi:MAG: N-acetylgalactosamine-N, N-diacetylbacillosaminyl-diphospho-undecaprenol [Planctomycetota bacterium]
MSLRRIRVLCAIGAMHGGGSERQMVQILKHLDRKRFEPYLYLVYRSGPLLDQIPGDVPVFAFEERVRGGGWYFPGRMHARRVADYAACLQELRADVSYDRTFLMTLITAAGAQRIGVPNVSTIVTNPETGFAPVAGRFQWFKRRLLHRLYNRSTRVLAVSEGARNAAIRFYGIAPERIVTQYNGIDTVQLQQQSMQAVSDQWWTMETGSRPVFRIVGAGRLNREKGWHLLIEAVSRLVQEDPQTDYRLAVLGEGGHRKELQRQIDQSGLHDVVHLPGFQTNAAAWYRSASVFVLPSLVEGMPNVLLEAMVCGTPVISSDCESGPAEILEGGRWGALCRVNDAGALQMAIREVRQQAEAAKFRAIEAKTAIESHWTIQAATDRLQEILEAAAKQKPGFSENPSW